MIRREARAKHVGWNYNDVYSLIMPCPASKEVDAILEKTRDDNWTAKLEEEWGEAVMDEEQCDADDIPRSSGDEGQEIENFTDGGSSEAESVCASSAVQPLDPPDLAPAEADLVQETNERQHLLHTMSNELASHGFMHAAGSLKMEMTKERRRQRAAARESPAVAEALRQVNIKDSEMQQQKRRQLRALNDQKESVEHLDQLITKKTAELKRKKLEVLRFESLMETKHALKTFTPECLGDGQAKGGGAKCRDRRHEVMNRLARLGSGLTVPQRNGWEWFKGAWDAHHVGHYDMFWGSIFAGWMQKVLEDVQKPEKANAFSEFVHRETARVFSDTPALCL